MSINSGDDYTLIWDERFVNPLQVAEPADYTAIKPTSVAWVDHKDIKEVGWPCEEKIALADPLLLPELRQSYPERPARFDRKRAPGLL
jgi:hypothetical protein